MDRPVRNGIANATQDLRQVLEDDYRTQLDRTSAGQSRKSR
jgi:hypothetical protein